MRTIPSHSVVWNAELSQELLETLGLLHQARVCQLFPIYKKNILDVSKAMKMSFMLPIYCVMKPSLQQQPLR